VIWPTAATPHGDVMSVSSASRDITWHLQQDSWLLVICHVDTPASRPQKPDVPTSPQCVAAMRLEEAVGRWATSCRWLKPLGHPWIIYVPKQLTTEPAVPVRRQEPLRHCRDPRTGVSCPSAWFGLLAEPGCFSRPGGGPQAVCVPAARYLVSRLT
jgi:hypothetical protein